MSFSSWLRKGKRSGPAACRRTRMSRGRRASFRPRLEALEERTMLSTYTVGSLTDTGAGSGLTGDLRYCVTHATSGNDIITFAHGLTGRIDLGSTLTLNASVDIQGPGASLLTVEPKDVPGNDARFGSFFAVGSTASVEISGLTISGINKITGDQGNGGIANNGTLTVSDCIFSANSNIYGGGAIKNNRTAIVSNSTFNGNNSGAGGAIFNSGVLTLNSSTIEANYLNAGVNYVNAGPGGDANGRGGAIFNQGALTINNSTLAHNSAQGGTGQNDGYLGDGMGGAIFMSAGTLSINSSTLSDNWAQGGDVDRSDDSDSPGNGKGGGLFIAGGTVSINNSTIADNLAIPGVFANGNTTAYSYGGGICKAAGPSALQMYDTILADNSADSGADPDLVGSVTSLGRNLIGNSTGGGGFVASDLVNVNPQLGPLQNNGGPTQTRALLAGSPAIDAGDNANAPAYDQRGTGFARIVNGAIDIGAFELQSVPPSPSGDYNRNHVVDAADYVLWRKTLGTAGIPPLSGADGSGNGTVDAVDYNVWRGNFGATSAPAGGLDMGGTAEGGALVAATSIEQSSPVAPPTTKTESAEAPLPGTNLGLFASQKAAQAVDLSFAMDSGFGTTAVRSSLCSPVAPSLPLLPTPAMVDQLLLLFPAATDSKALSTSEVDQALTKDASTTESATLLSAIDSVFNDMCVELG